MYKKGKYVLQIIIIIITAFLGFNLYFYVHIKDSYKTGFYQVGNNFTTQTSNALKSWVDDQTKVVKMIANDQRIIDACRYPENKEIVDEAQKYLQDLHKLYPYYENLPLSIKLDKEIVKTVKDKEVIIHNGEFLIDTVGGKTIGKGGMNYSYIQEIFNGKEYFVSEIYPSILRKNPIFVISAPIIYDSEIIGVAIISPQIKYFTKIFVENVKFKETGYLFFVDERGQIIAHPNENFILNKSKEAEMIGQRIISRFKRGENYFEDYIYETTKLYVGTKVDIDPEHIKHDWHIIFTQAKAEVFKNVDRFLMVILIMVFIATIIVAWAIYLVSKINQRELYKEELEKINKSLENKVEERTKELKKLAVTDSLTNLYNHQTSYKILEEEINKARENSLPLVIMMGDLDKFKLVNDTYGHPVGDEVIVSTANIILSNIKETDIAGRYGGEEFIVILSKTELEDGIEIANKIKKSVSDNEYSCKELKVTISIGMCRWMGESAIELVNKADQLLYKAKLNGRNRIEVE